MDVNTLRIIATLACFVTFIGIFAWAWARRNQAAFDEAARIPFDQD
ncbi:MAG: CcoQ/FixQ family Cbb3-type cytochrome c oxidase assembly chaperone [Burkholderiaceae bacterium]|nr:CcoQ/FixQ family Cbb3-type cytochrome c oxidase assembly chaperone [Burkholderiaceae bacterium]